MGPVQPVRMSNVPPYVWGANKWLHVCLSASIDCSIFSDTIPVLKKMHVLQHLEHLTRKPLLWSAYQKSCYPVCDAKSDVTYIDVMSDVAMHVHSLLYCFVALAKSHNHYTQCIINCHLWYKLYIYTHYRTRFWWACRKGRTYNILLHGKKGTEKVSLGIVSVGVSSFSNKKLVVIITISPFKAN